MHKYIHHTYIHAHIQTYKHNVLISFVSFKEKKIVNYDVGTPHHTTHTHPQVLLGILEYKPDIPLCLAQIHINQLDNVLVRHLFQNLDS
jgi:hypothetical protein